MGQSLKAQQRPSRFPKSAKQFALISASLLPAPLAGLSLLSVLVRVAVYPAPRKHSAPTRRLGAFYSPQTAISPCHIPHHEEPRQQLSLRPKALLYYLNPPTTILSELASPINY